jgi:cytochrome c peroxidase
MKQVIALLLIAATGFAESTHLPADIRSSISAYMTLLESDADSLVANKDKIDLGRILFYDKRLSGNSELNCQSCHNLNKYGTGGDYFKTLRDEGKLFRDVPGLYNLKHLKLFTWTGRETDLANKITDSLSSQHEMNTQDTEGLIVRLKGVPAYAALFKTAYPDVEDPITLENIAQALTEFINGLVTPAPIDRFLKGDDQALTEKQLQGAHHFIQENCFACHTGSRFGGQIIMKIGITEPWPNQADQGLYETNHDPRFKMNFRVPPLRNSVKTAPFFHDASSRYLLDAIRKMGQVELGKHIPDEHVLLIYEFLKSLTGEIPMDYIKEPTVP